jgi:hypothetical protein
VEPTERDRSEVNGPDIVGDFLEADELSTERLERRRGA